MATIFAATSLDLTEEQRDSLANALINDLGTIYKHALSFNLVQIPQDSCRGDSINQTTFFVCVPPYATLEKKRETIELLHNTMVRETGDQGELKKSLDMVVESCVNTVGVNLNTASRHLLMYVSGLNATTAKNIVEYREKNGAFHSRAELKKVPRLGPVAFVQCAGFLRIPGARNPLDDSAVHPESYDIVKRMAADKGCTVRELIDNKEMQKTIRLDQYVSDSVGMPTLTDIMAELKRPGRDPRQEVEAFEFDPRVHEVADLQVGMLLPGIVTNITAFGCFVDVGVHHDGLVHISQLADRYVKDPNDVVKLHQHVVVRVTEVDQRRCRISLSMKE